MSYFLENEEVEKVEEVKEQDGIASIEPLLDNRIVRAIREMGFEKLSPIQEQAIPYLLQGEDIIGQAQTGTGKTASFGIPMLKKVDPKNRHVQAIVLCPTRELAIQSADEIRKLDELKNKVAAVLKQALGVAVRVKLVEPKTIERSEGKAKRVIDNRGL